MEAGADAGSDGGLDAVGPDAPDASPAADADVGGGGDAPVDLAPEALVCPAGFADCNDQPGCETDVTTVLNCGGCGRSCPSGGGYRCCPMSETNRCPRADQPCS
jgi:hypothetical protein